MQQLTSGKHSIMYHTCAWNTHTQSRVFWFMQGWCAAATSLLRASILHSWYLLSK